jgi:hypothetical protein
MHYPLLIGRLVLVTDFPFLKISLVKLASLSIHILYVKTIVTTASNSEVLNPDCTLEAPVSGPASKFWELK